MTEDFDRFDEEGATGDNTVKGYKILIIVLIVLLAALGFQYWRQTNILRGSEQELSIERDTLKNRLTNLLTDFDGMKIENDTLNQNMMIERHKADSLMSRLKSERQWSYAKVKKYEKELGTLRSIMKGYVHQIDSLNQMNNKLSRENVTFRQQLSTTRQRAEMAEEKSQELQSKIRTGAVVKARDISLLALNDRDKAVSRAARATRMRADFVLNANSITLPGERNVYIRIIDGSGAVMTDSSSMLFEQDGAKIQATAMRGVDYQGDDLPVSISYRGKITGGTYNVQIYMDGYMIGSNEIILK
ncbi:MAG: hypothetical protein RR141_02510 [Rikenellaceae bacterium]